MPRKSVTSELEQILRSLPHMTAEELELALERLSTFDIESPEGPVRRPGVTCPFTQMQVVSPCNLTKCKFHVENEWSRNCLLEYMDQQNSETLAVEEIAYLYQKPTEEVSSALEQAMAQLRENPEETVGIEGDFKRSSPRQFKINLDDAEDIEVTKYSIAPSFMDPVNRTLAIAASDDAVFAHPAIRVLGILDSIISELE